MPVADRDRPLRRLLAAPGFVRLWLAGGLTNTMRMQEILVAGIFTYDLTGSALAVSLVLMVRALPMLLMGALAGALAESLDRKRMLMTGQAAAAIGAFAVALLAATGQIALWHLALSGFVSGLVWTNEHATRRRMVAEIAGPRDMVPAVALDTTTGSMTRMLGPLLGGLFLQTLGLAAAYLCAGVLYGVALLLVSGVAYRQEYRAVVARHLPTEIATAARIALRHPTIRAVLAVTVLMNVFAFSYNAVLPAFGRLVFDATALEIGLLAAAEPAGALIGGLLIASGRGAFAGVRGFVAGSAGFVGLLLLASFLPVYGVVAALLLVGGIGTAAFAAHQTALVILDAPPEARSRLLGLITTCIGMGPFGVLMIGALADLIGPAPAISVMAALGLAGLAAIGVSLGRAGPRTNGGG